MATGIRKIIDENADNIVESWEAEAKKSVAGQGLTRAELVNRLPAFLASLLRSEGATADPNLVSQRWLIDSHLADRLRQGFELPEMVEEFHILGRCLERTWSGRADVERPNPLEIERLHEELRRATTAAMALFSENLIQYQQSEKRFLRRLQKVTDDALVENGIVSKRVALQRKLGVIADALQAETTGLYFYEPEGRQLRLVAYTGIKDDLKDQYVTPLGAPSFASRLVDTRGGLYVADVATSDLDVPEPLRKTGARSILGMPLLPRGVLFGALYVGVRETRLFEPREVRMFESLGERLGLLLDDERMQGDLKATNHQLRIEREMRERFVAVLAHDLLGPLAAAKMGTQLLLSHPELLNERSSVPAQIIGDLERTDRMVRDLLDVHQIRAGHRLTLRLGKTDLVAITQDVVQELTTIHGDRFSVNAAAHEWGFWSAPDMRRALWNLASNAIKYGGKATPIEIRVASNEGIVELTVHNEGSVILAEDRANLFEPFSRSISIQAAAERGWGLGLTLVKGCAEAHGGAVEIESEAERGTTFTLRFPSDARPFQPRANEGAPPLQPRANVGVP
jgi:signal transduction histidine kinase